jgi:hypothetical protein
VDKISKEKLSLPAESPLSKVKEEKKREDDELSELSDTSQLDFENDID